MEEKIWDLYCFQCSLQFDKKSIYDMHQSIRHGYKNVAKPVFETEIKHEPEETEFVLESNFTENHSLNTNSVNQKCEGIEIKCDF